MITIDDLAKVIYEAQNASNIDLLPVHGAKRSVNPHVPAQLDKAVQEITGQSVVSLRKASQETVQVKDMKEASKIESSGITAYVDLSVEDKNIYLKQAIYIMRRFDIR